MAYMVVFVFAGSKNILSIFFQAITQAAQFKRDLEYSVASNSKLNALRNQTGLDLPNIPINQLANVQRQLYLEMEQLQQVSHDDFV